MFMQWLQYKMMPTFRKQFPGKICIPCCDNAPYHHNRGVPSLSGVTKKADIVKLMREGVPGAGADGFKGLPAGATITLPVVSGKRNAPVHVRVDSDDMLLHAQKSLPTVPTIPELKAGFLETLRTDATLKRHLDCKLEKFIEAQNAEIRPNTKLSSAEWSGSSWMLWTPPYSPTLQPIEEFWGAGKNYAASLYENGRTMKTVVRQLQAGWYGDDGSGEFPNKERNGPKQAVDCGALVRRAIAEANKKAKLVGGLTGTVQPRADGQVGLLHDGESELVEGDGDTDMSVKHVELVDLTQPDATDAEIQAAPPLVLTEEEHEEELAEQLSEGAELDIDADDADLQLGAPPQSPARTAQDRHAN